MPAARIAPVPEPYSPAVADALRRLMGRDDVEPLLLFRTIARHEALLDRFRQTGSTLLSFGTLDAGDRETMIHRTCARCGAEYEWGVHAATFAPAAGFDADWLAATVHGQASDPAFTPRQALVVELADQLHDTAQISDELWPRLSEAFTEEQLLELLALAGFYHLVSYVCVGLRLDPEPWATRFPAVAASPRGLAPPADAA